MNKITIKGCLSGISAESSISVYEESFEFKYNTKVLLTLPANSLSSIAETIISSTHDQWDTVYNLHFPNKTGLEVYLVATCFNIVKFICVDWNGTSLYGKKLEDNLKGKNFLLIPNSNIQTKLLKDLKGEKLFELGRLFKCAIENNSTKEEFYFRPYHTPVIGMNQLINLEEINDELKTEYERILEC